MGRVMTLLVRVNNRTLRCADQIGSPPKDHKLITMSQESQEKCTIKITTDHQLI